MDLEWLAEITSSLRYGGEADTALYCWLAKEGVLAALLEVAEAQGSRPAQVRVACMCLLHAVAGLCAWAAWQFSLACTVCRAMGLGRGRCV